MSDTEALNKVYFNKLAADYEAKFQSVIRVLDNEVKGSVDFIGVKSGSRFLDYACGTGLLSWALSDSTSQSIGIDISASMVGAYNSKALSQGFAPDVRTAYSGNLLLLSDPAPADFTDVKFFNFDVAGISTAFHHFDDPELATRRVAERLRSGGVLFIVDFLPHEMNDDNRARGVRHAGFTEERVREIFEGAGVCSDFGFKVFNDEIVLRLDGHGHGHGHGDGDGDGGGHGHGHITRQHHGSEHSSSLGDGHGHTGPHSEVRRRVFLARGTKQ